MALAAFFKDPQAILDYRLDWSEWLDDGDTIFSATWTVPTGISQLSTSQTGTTTTIRLTGGTSSNMYNIVCRVVTTSNQEDERSITIIVQDN